MRVGVGDQTPRGTEAVVDMVAPVPAWPGGRLFVAEVSPRRRLAREGGRRHDLQRCPEAVVWLRRGPWVAGVKLRRGSRWGGAAPGRCQVGCSR